MFNFLKSSSSKTTNAKNSLKGYKITNVERSKKYGIAANSLTMLIEKSCQKFNINECRLYLAQDGSAIEDEDYFQTIAAQTLFVVARKSDVVKTDFELLYDTIKNANLDILHAGELAKTFINDNKKDLSTLLYETHKNITSKTAYSTKAEHPEWFENSSGQVIDKGSSTKEEVMSRKSRDRLRGYYYKVKDDLIKNEIYRRDQKSRALIDEILSYFNHFLVGVDYFSCLFNRKFKRKITDVIDNDGRDGDCIDGQPMTKKLKTSIKNYFDVHNPFDDVCQSLCTEQGDFHCQGAWNEKCCLYQNHVINPYSSRESLILFQTWNLDHQIELSRTVIPSLIKSIKELSSNDDDDDGDDCDADVDDESNRKCRDHNRMAINVSVIKYFLEIFTLDNLKLVHIVCHDKSSHQLLKNSRGGLICKDCDDFVILKHFRNNI